MEDKEATLGYILKFGRIIIIVEDNDSDWHLDDIVILRVPRRVDSVLNGHQELERVLALKAEIKRKIAVAIKYLHFAPRD